MEGYSRCSAAHGNFVAIGVGKSVLVYRISDLVMGRDIVNMGFHNDVRSVAVSPCGELAVAGLRGGQVVMRSLRDEGFERIFLGHDSDVWRVLFSSCGSLLISGSHDGKVKIWDAATGVCLSTVDCGGTV